MSACGDVNFAFYINYSSFKNLESLVETKFLSLFFPPCRPFLTMIKRSLKYNVVSSLSKGDQQFVIVIDI